MATPAGQDTLNNKSKRGGARPGAGRKPGKMEAATVEKMRALEAYKQKVRELAPDLLELQVKAAKAGDMRTIESMLDRAFGKATQPISGDDEGSPIVTLVKFIDAPDATATDTD